MQHQRIQKYFSSEHLYPVLIVISYADSNDTIPKALEIIKTIKTIFCSDLITAIIAVIGVTLLFGSISLYLAWLTYQERYGISFDDFLKLNF
tara:strand:- start:996 stop:1271 length:276 start_codon:yes stop_codon:yes gene_type:complete